MSLACASFNCYWNEFFTHTHARTFVCIYAYTHTTDKYWWRLQRNGYSTYWIVQITTSLNCHWNEFWFVQIGICLTWILTSVIELLCVGLVLIWMFLPCYWNEFELCEVVLVWLVWIGMSLTSRNSFTHWL